jgi:hypothetical protein
MYLLASNYIDIVLCTAYFVFVFVLTFPHPGLYWIYGNKDDDDITIPSGKQPQCILDTRLCVCVWGGGQSWHGNCGKYTNLALLGIKLSLPSR